mmetsp:Transcript_73689/g.238177  ORF Transcript_73689/g.238177 Transcript_73689/m.238177 type:complete len:319 (+) Transcript_73689:371-1327(+)
MLCCDVQLAIELLQLRDEPLSLCAQHPAAVGLVLEAHGHAGLQECHSALLQVHRSPAAHVRPRARLQLQAALLELQPVPQRALSLHVRGIPRGGEHRVGLERPRLILLKACLSQLLVACRLGRLGGLLTGHLPGGSCSSACLAMPRSVAFKVVPECHVLVQLLLLLLERLVLLLQLLPLLCQAAQGGLRSAEGVPQPLELCAPERFALVAKPREGSEVWSLAELLRCLCVIPNGSVMLFASATAVLEVAICNADVHIQRIPQTRGPGWLEFHLQLAELVYLIISENQLGCERPLEDLELCVDGGQILQGGLCLLLGLT